MQRETIQEVGAECEMVNLYDIDFKGLQNAYELGRRLVKKAQAPLSSPEGDTIVSAHDTIEAPSGAVGGASWGSATSVALV